MAVRIRLKRIGKIHHPVYRVAVVDQRKKRDGRVLEEVGKYDPNQEPSFIEVTSDRVQYWLSVGAQPSDAVHRLLVLSGDWAKFKGAKNTESRIRYKETVGETAVENAVQKAADAAEKLKAKASEEKAKAEAQAAVEAAKAEESPAEESVEAAAEEPAASEEA